MSDIERCYEELRRVIDGGSESMTHEDALATVRLWSEQERVPSSCPYIRSSNEGTHWCALAEQPTDHRAVMRQAIEALRDAHAYSVMHEEFRDGVLDVIDALRAALGEKK